MNFLFYIYIFTYYILTFIVMTHQLHKKHHRFKAMTKQSRESRNPKIKLSNHIIYSKELHNSICKFTKNSLEITNKITRQVVGHKSRSRILKKHVIPYSEELHYHLKGDLKLRNRKKNFVNHENSIIEKKNHLKLYHKILQSFGRSLRRSKLSRTLNTHVLKKHLIPLSTENDILLSKDDIYTSKYPFIKSELNAEPNQLTILKHAALDDIVNTAVNKVVSQIESRKTSNKIQDARILNSATISGYKRNKNSTLYTSNNSTSSDTQIMSDLLENNSEDEKLSVSKMDDKENVLVEPSLNDDKENVLVEPSLNDDQNKWYPNKNVEPSLNADQNKWYPNKNVMYKLQLTDDNDSEKNVVKNTSKSNSQNIEELKEVHTKQSQAINKLTDNQSKPSIISQSNSLSNNQSNGLLSRTLVSSVIQKNTSENGNNNTTLKGFYLDPFENIDSENTTAIEDNLAKSVLEKNLLKDADSTAINEERMGYDIRDFYTNREEEDTDYRDKIARRKHRRINNLAAVKKDSLASADSVKKDTLDNSNDRVEINNIIKTFYDGGFNFLEPDSKFMHISENEDSFRTKESDDDSHTENEDKQIENDSETDHPELADAKTIENITKNETELSNLVPLTKDNNYNSQGIKLLEHKDVIETDDSSFDEINIDEQNLHLEAKIDSIAAREKVLKDLTDVIKVLRNLQPIHDGNDIERTKSTNKDELYDEEASPAFTEKVLDLQSDKPSPSSYTVTLNGNVYKLEKLSKDSQFAPKFDSQNQQFTSAEGKDSQNLPKDVKDYTLQRDAKDSRLTPTGRKNSKLSSAEREKDSPVISYGGKDSSLTTAVENSAPLLPQGGIQPSIGKEANGSTSPTTLVLNIQTGNPNANYNFERVYSDHDAKQTFKQGETYSPTVVLDSSEITKANNSPIKLPNLQNNIQNMSDGIYEKDTANEITQNGGIAKKPDNTKENKHPSYILHNLHHKTFKIQQIDDVNEINSKSEAFDPVSNQDIFEIRHNDKIFKIIEIKNSSKLCEEIVKPCTAVHDDDVKHIIAARPDGNSLSGKNFTGKTIHVTYKNPSKDIDIVREAVSKEVTKDLSNKNIREENMKIFSPNTIYSNASVENDGEDLVNETTIDNKNIIFKDDELTKITEDDQLNKMSFVKPETQSDSSGEFRDRVPDENYDTFIFQIPRSNNTDIKSLNKENKNKETDTDETKSRENTSSNEENRTNKSNNLEETLNEQIVP